MLRYIFVFTLFFFVQTLHAEDPRYAELRSTFFSLRNTDLTVARYPEWQALLEDLQQYVKAQPRGEHAAAALFSVAIIEEELARRRREPARFSSALRVLDRVVAEYPEDPIADDALIRQGDIQAFDLKNAAAAREIYEAARRRYPLESVRKITADRLERMQGAAPAQKLSGGKGPLIVIDPGHGGDDYGAIGAEELAEKDITLSVALELKRILERDAGAVVRLTRTEDVFVPLAERTNMANDYDASLFISLHVNASPQGALSGIESFYLDNTDDAGSKKLAERENGVSSSTRDGDLGFILSDLIQNAKLEDSVRLTHALQDALVAEVRRKWTSVKNLGVRKGPFYVLVGAHMPCALVEMLFIDNPEDWKRLRDARFHAVLATGIARGVKKYLAEAA